MEICQTGNCTGCMACMNSCPYDAIQEKQNERGFYIPSVDEEKCVKCGLCRQVCPANRHEEVTLAPEVFACWNTDKEVRQYSSSGGMFTLLAKAVLEQGGVVLVLCLTQTPVLCCIKWQERYKNFVPWLDQNMCRAGLAIPIVR